MDGRYTVTVESSSCGKAGRGDNGNQGAGEHCGGVS